MKNKIEVKYVPIGKIKKIDDNPNKQTDKTFDLLVESIREDGMFDPIDVVPIKEKEGDFEYQLIGGEHRLDACELLGYAEIPVIVHDSYDNDKQKAMTVKLNVLRGKIDPAKFIKLYQQLSQKYNDEVLKRMMGFAEEEQFKKLVSNVQKNLPDELKEKLKSKENEIKNVDDLAVILNELFRNHGKTLNHSFMVFDFGGKNHIWVRMNEDLNKLMKGLVKECQERNLDLAEELVKRFWQAE